MLGRGNISGKRLPKPKPVRGSLAIENRRFAFSTFRYPEEDSLGSVKLLMARAGKPRAPDVSQVAAKQRTPIRSPPSIPKK